MRGRKSPREGRKRNPLKAEAREAEKARSTAVRKRNDKETKNHALSECGFKFSLSNEGKASSKRPDSLQMLAGEFLQLLKCFFADNVFDPAGVLGGRIFRNADSGKKLA